jgi:hypothetical protein
MKIDKVNNFSPHVKCACTKCDSWREKQVNHGDLCIPFAEKFSDGSTLSRCLTWERGGPLKWGYRVPLNTLLWCLWEEPNIGVDAHLAPILILVPDGTVRVTSKSWLTVIQKISDLKD